MKAKLRFGKPFAVEKVPDFCSFVCDSQEVEAIKDHLGNKPSLEKFDSFFVYAEDGDYSFIYGMRGIIPYLNKTVQKITLKFVP